MNETSENLINGNITEIMQSAYIDYSMSVIVSRALPDARDGFKPVQRRILHSMKELDDGRYNKVANIIGNTMKYHPHGDASIGDAIVQIGQKDLLIDCQGNWGNLLTGDGAAAPRNKALAARTIRALITRSVLMQMTIQHEYPCSSKIIKFS